MHSGQIVHRSAYSQGAGMTHCSCLSHKMLLRVTAADVLHPMACSAS